jgi:phosphoribosylglycinamide formyltransferase-1
MKIKIVIISANEIRHRFFRKKLSSFKNIDVKLCLAEKNQSRQFYKIYKSKKYTSLEKNHFKKREISEKLYFNKFLKETPDVSNLKIIDRGEFNYNKNLIYEIDKLKPNLIVSFGCSLIKGPLLKKYKKKFLNIHLGLSPYYKGSATNFWPFVNNELQFVGVSFLGIDDGIDTGPIIHQIRPDFRLSDNIHDVGNKLIIKMTEVTSQIIFNFKKLNQYKQKKIKKEKIFYKKNFNYNAVKKLNLNLKNKMIKKYLLNKTKIDKKFPIIKQNI